MQTPWGDVPVRDAHAHLFSRNFFRILASQKAGLPEENPDHAIVEQLGWDLPPEDTAQLAARWVEELDRYGVEQIALMASLPGDEQSAADAARAFPDRIQGGEKCRLAGTDKPRPGWNRKGPGNNGSRQQPLQIAAQDGSHILGGGAEFFEDRNLRFQHSTVPSPWKE